MEKVNRSDTMATAGIILDRLSGALFVLWLFLPIGASTAVDGTYPVMTALALPFEYLRLSGLSLAGIALFAAWAMPLFGLWKLSGFALDGIKGERFGPGTRLSAFLRIAATVIPAYCFVVPFAAYGDRPAYFAAVPVIAYVVALLAFAGNVASVILAIRILNRLDPVYNDFVEFRKTLKAGEAATADRKNKLFAAFEVVYRIKTKLIIAFMSVVGIVVIVLSTVTLTGYRATIFKAVSDGARNQAEQAAAIYKINLGDSLAMFEYLDRQSKLNERAEFHFASFEVFSNLKVEVYLDALSGGNVPDFASEYSTLAPGKRFPDRPAIPGAVVAKYGAVEGSAGFADVKAKVLTFISPITTKGKASADGVRRDRLIGLAAIIFDEDVIFEPFFRTRSSVIAITVFFLYLSAIIVFIVGDRIVRPLLYLRMGVRRISNSLRGMIRGETRVSAENLVYSDHVITRDEIKSLSGEIGEMVTVIRGIVPYISASTLKQAEKGTSSSVEKNLTFLFTDIRGFTTLCEGKRPDEVVSILNRYLGLETEIVIRNHGDVDKFVGDELMAFFDGPEKELNACRAAMELRHTMQEEREAREKEGLVTVEIGIGVNTGPVVFGSVGAQDRMDFTSIGDTVNLAARLEGANKEYRSKTIITDAVYRLVKDEFVCRELDFVAVKGKRDPVRIYELLQATSRAAEKLDKIRKVFEMGLIAYRKKNWAKARIAFEKNIAAFKDGPSAIFLDRVAYFEKYPVPEDWDGVFRMTVK
ncbi:MAG: adenylate/guanylate cyclase domain-containing protein [Spirochaetes bacterium]|nr:adenylate/guanylate cyclase domain-containing protein [Spirochaetota bacterium]